MVDSAMAAGPVTRVCAAGVQTGVDPLSEIPVFDDGGRAGCVGVVFRRRVGGVYSV